MKRKGKNLAGNRHVILTTGCNALHEGMDLVVEGAAARVSDEPKLRRVADEYFTKYGEEWRFTVRDGAFLNPLGGEAVVYEVRPQTAFGFGRTGSWRIGGSDNQYSQTRWRF